MQYLVALGSNRPHHRLGTPRRVLAAALEALDRDGLTLLAASPVIASAPIGPSIRTYANGAALIETAFDPEALLDHLQRIEHAFGRRQRGQRWSARVLDLDIVLWSGGPWSSPGLIIPHPLMRQRGFVLRPAAAICPTWRDPLTGRTLVQLHRALTRPRPLP